MRNLTVTLCLTCLLIISPNVVLGEQVSGSFNCKIKDITISAIDEGVPKTYKGLKNGANIGESMRFAYKLENTNYMTFKRTDQELSHPEGFVSFDEFKIKDDATRRLFPRHYFSINSKVTISSEDITVKSIRSEELFLTRYYKNDWQGLMVRTTLQSVAVYSLDCRNTADPLEEILQSLKQRKY